MSAQKVAIITGAGRGMGRAIAVEMARHGFTCVLVARSREQLEETAKSLAGESLVVPCDLRDGAAIDAVVAQAVERFGRIDLLVNNAGVAPLLPFEKITPAVWDEVFAINVQAVYRFSYAVWPVMTKQNASVIVNISSEAARDPFAGFTAYAASKAAVNMFTRTLAKEGDPHNIRVHAIAPAGVETSMLRAIADEKLMPRDHTLDPEDVANAVRSCVIGDLRITSGETIYVHRRI